MAVIKDWGTDDKQTVCFEFGYSGAYSTKAPENRTDRQNSASLELERKTKDE
ncbi:hypothetical protein bsdcttw_40030 [Anaerocolumna chitinilytica]|uniref:Uncharacterized protein n=1 Tax=Anaerocolumna chitinilytica TaxID=1727145 RepID=A0A7I8DRR6_9FIRM|nr:hypothetical protein bsdcttw_40030 [Anaerocolumna chitinilytica]